MIAICRTLFAQLRAIPAHSGELVSQLRKGEWVILQNPGDDWCEVQTEHGYSGWTRTAQLSLVPDEKKTLLERCMLYQDPETAYLLPDLATQKGLGIPLKDPDSSFVSLSDPVWDPKIFCLKALAFSGVPYVWGGKTPYGLDCSGLVQLTMNLCGFSFPRDAWQQSEIGENVPFQKESQDFEEGDLLYFQHPGKRVHHVAISLGKALYLHASEWVRVNSLDPGSPDFAPERAKTLVLARKIKETHLGPLLQSFKSLLKY